jgi:hypothetical protein
MNDHIAKPIRLEELAGKIDYWIRRGAGEEEMPEVA